MQINFEKEKTFIMNKEQVSDFIRYILGGDFVVGDERITANKVKIFSSIHFYFETKNNEKDVYKFKETRGKFILSRVKKLVVQESEKFFNIELTEKVEHLDEEQLRFDNIYSALYKERMMIDFRKRGFKISFDRVTAIHPIGFNLLGEPRYFCEIEYDDPANSFDNIIAKFKLEYLDESKYSMGILDPNLCLDRVVSEKGIYRYLDEMRQRCYSGFFEQFATQYYYYNKRTEIELKIKNPSERTVEELLFELTRQFVVSDGGVSFATDEYYDYNDILLVNNLSYRIRKIAETQDVDLFFKVPLEDKGLFSTRVEYISKFHGYDKGKILGCDCYSNKMLDRFLGCKVSDKLVKVLEAITSRQLFLLFDKSDAKFLVGVLLFDKSEFVKGEKSCCS
jgi:hypothetical protein